MVHQWERIEKELQNKTKTVRLTKLTKTFARRQFVSLLSKLLKDYPVHKFTSQHQLSQYTCSLKEVDSGAAVCVLDFAENYSCSVQGEVQSAYYSRNSVTLHPIVCIYNIDGKVIRDSVVFITDDLKHDFAAVYSFVRGLSAHIQMMSSNVKKLIMWSDGASQSSPSQV